MLGRITEDQLKELMQIKQDGTYRHGHGKNVRIRREALWNVLYKYLTYRGALSFKARYFRKDRERYMKHASMVDCPLDGGQLINAIKYGIENGHIHRTGGNNNIRWVLNNGSGEKHG
jgi:hypothetical protein